MINRFTGKYRFLNNFFPSHAKYDGESYPTVEHAYQAAKTLDASDRRKIRRCKTPGDAKRMGRQVDLRDGWEQIKLGIMEDLLRQKFAARDLRKKLNETKSEQLVEGNTWGDTYWGVCKGKGENWLGRLLMKVRDE